MQSCNMRKGRLAFASRLKALKVLRSLLDTTVYTEWQSAVTHRVTEENSTARCQSGYSVDGLMGRDFDRKHKQNLVQKNDTMTEAA